MSLDIEVDFGIIEPWLARIIHFQDAIQEDTKQTIAWWLEDTMYEEAPGGLSNRLRDSIYAEVIGDTIRCVPDIWYAWFVESGTSASSGVYISKLKPLEPQFPYIGGRAKWGTHKGTPANPFVSRTFDRLLDELGDFLDPLLQWFVEVP